MNPVTPRVLCFKSLWNKTVSDFIENPLPVLQHEINCLLGTPDTPFRCCILCAAAANTQAHQPFHKVLVILFVEKVYENNNAHQRLRERDALKSNRPPIFLVQSHKSVANMKHVLMDDGGHAEEGSLPTRRDPEAAHAHRNGGGHAHETAICPCPATAHAIREPAQAPRERRHRCDCSDTKRKQIRHRMNLRGKCQRGQHA